MANTYLDGLRKHAAGIGDALTNMGEHLQDTVKNVGDSLESNLTRRIQSDPIGFVSQYPSETWGFIKSDPSRAARLIIRGMRNYAGRRAAPFKQDYSGAMGSLSGTGFWPTHGMVPTGITPREPLVE